MKKFACLLVLACAVLAAGCHHKKEEPYNRSDYKKEYERLLRTHVFAACISVGKPYATYSLADLNRKPVDNDPRYKVTFINGPCEGKTVFTKDVIVKTQSVDAGLLPKGTVVLRNYWNPRTPYDTDRTDRWHKGVVYSTANIDKGVVELEFPRDRNDFMASRENVLLHNVRYIVKPETKDVRTYL